MKSDGGSFTIRDRNAIQQEPVLIHPAQLCDHAATFENLLAHTQVFEHAHGVGPHGNRGAHVEQYWCLFEDFGLKSGLLQCERGSQAADAAADDRDLDHSAESATKSTKRHKNFLEINLCFCAFLWLVFCERFDVQEHACMNPVDHLVGP